MFNFKNTYLELPAEFYTLQNPVKVKKPEICLFNSSLADALALNIPNDEILTDILSGNQIPSGTTPLSQAYAGHQFGYFTNLGDGRAVLLGEHQTENGLVDIQFKGSGQTPYSRGEDGRASLGPMLREYIISEALFFLGIPTTRSLAVVKTGEPVYRKTIEKGSILTRIAASHLRIGTFQYAAAMKDNHLLASLLDYAIDRHYPNLANTQNKAASFLEEVGKRQASLIGKWMKVGFIHGVMNTDNTSISGETIDYGPCAFMDEYDPTTVFSSIDTNGRYSYQNQLNIIHWNMTRLAEALLPLINNNESKAIEIAEDILKRMSAWIEEAYLTNMALKIGITDPKEEDWDLVGGILQWMYSNNLDFTNTFRKLSYNKLSHNKLSHNKLAENEIFQDEEFILWYKKWMARMEGIALDKMTETMKANNPVIIPRNHKVEQAIKKAEEENNLSPLHSLLEALENPYTDNTDIHEFQKLPLESERVKQTFCGT